MRTASEIYRTLGALHERMMKLVEDMGGADDLDDFQREYVEFFCDRIDWVLATDLDEIHRTPYLNELIHKTRGRVLDRAYQAAIEGGVTVGFGSQFQRTRRLAQSKALRDIGTLLLLAMSNENPPISIPRDVC